MAPVYEQAVTAATAALAEARGSDEVYFASMVEHGWTDLLSLLLWIFSRAWLVGGIIALSAGCGFAVYQLVWLARSVTAQGNVVKLIQIRDEEQNTTSYAPQFTFRNQHGDAYTVTSGVRTSPAEFQVGEQVRVRYIRDNPSSAKLDGFWQLWLVPFVCSILGMFFVPAGYLLLRLERRIGLPSHALR